MASAAPHERVSERRDDPLTRAADAAGAASDAARDCLETNRKLARTLDGCEAAAARRDASPKPKR